MFYTGIEGIRTIKVITLLLIWHFTEQFLAKGANLPHPLLIFSMQNGGMKAAGCRSHWDYGPLEADEPINHLKHLRSSMSTRPVSYQPPLFCSFVGKV